jgi:hypothetical protein
MSRGPGTRPLEEEQEMLAHRNTVFYNRASILQGTYQYAP